MPTTVSIRNSSSSAIVVAADGRILEQTETAGELATLWRNKNASLLRAVEDTRANGVPGEFHISNGGNSKVWVTAVEQADGTLLIARDTELVEKMAEALVESRTLLKSLLDGAVDLSFEVDLDGRFRFVSPANAFGQFAEQWLGRRAADILWSRGNVPARSPFTIKEKTQFDAVPIRIEGDQKRHVTISAEPSLDRDGAITGARGTVRDVTERIVSERAKRQEHLRVAVQQRITRILNASENAQELLEHASREIMDVMRADLVWSVMKYKNGLVPVSLAVTGMKC